MAEKKLPRSASELREGETLHEFTLKAILAGLLSGIAFMVPLGRFGSVS
ncbi:MAG: hypothetical protein V3S47_05245 [Acidobacteriota bacterium]